MNQEKTPDYVNFAKIMHSDDEFFLDFVTLYPQIQPTDNKQHGQVVGRFIMSPAHTKRIMQCLIENVQKYEQKHGVISPPKAPVTGNLTMN